MTHAPETGIVSALPGLTFGRDVGVRNIHNTVYFDIKGKYLLSDQLLNCTLSYDLY